MLKNSLKILILVILFFAVIKVFSSFAQEEFIYDVKGERNPFMPLITPEGALIKIKPRLVSSSGLELEGIIFDNISISYAIVNGMVVKVGDFVGDYQVLKIQEDKVTFIKDGEPFEVELEKEEG
ncbi:MAG: hypothetical protein WAQ07_02230 [Candidatus Omnitrophota bacterium]